jgi:hypothetical protein
VNYVYELGERANRELRQLPSWLGEEILDELEALVDSPLADRFKSPAGAVLDFKRQNGNDVFYVFLTFTAYPVRKLLHVTTIGTHVMRV